MKHIINLFLFYLILYIHTCAADLSSFISKPNQDNFNAYIKNIELLRDSVSLNDMTKYLSKEFSNNTKLQNLLTLIENGNEYSLRLYFYLRPILRNCPELNELFDISCGKLVKNNPKLLLKIVNEYEKDLINKNEIVAFEDFLCDYGEEFVDEFLKQIVETNERINSLEKVKDKNLLTIRDIFIQILNQHKKELEDILKEINKK